MYIYMDTSISISIYILLYIYISTSICLYVFIRFAVATSIRDSHFVEIRVSRASNSSFVCLLDSQGYSGAAVKRCRVGEAWLKAP